MIKWDHPVPFGRWTALQDDAFWVPLAGIVSMMSERLDMKPEVAGTLILEGMAKGKIAHTAEGSNSWVVSPRGADLARIAGFDYGTMINWKTGCVTNPGARPRPVLVYWPDVERLAREQALKHVAAQNPVAEQYPKDIGRAGQGAAERNKRGPRPTTTQRVTADMLNLLRTGGMSADTLSAEKEEALVSRFKASRDTCRKARLAALSEFVGVCR